MLLLKQEKNYIDMTGDNKWIRLIPITSNIIRCLFSKEEIKKLESLIIEKKERDIPYYDVKETENSVFLCTEEIMVEVNKITGKICWKDNKTGEAYLQEGEKEFIKIPIKKYTTGGEKPVINRVKTVDGERNFIQNLKEIADHEAYQGRLHFEWKENEGIYGLGQGDDGIYNYRHHTQYLYQHNMRIPMPVITSSEGYGLLFDCCSLMIFNDNEDGSYLFFDTIKQLDYYFVAGPSMDRIINGYRELTGDAAMLPKWAYGYIQSKEQYYTANELADVVRHYRELDVPIDCVVQDWNTWEPGCWGEKVLDKKRYGNLSEKMDEIHAMHAHSMVSVWPNMNTGGKNHTELFNAGYMLNDYATYNAFSKEAREMYWKQAKEELFQGGFDSWWCDSTEPFSGPDWNGEMKREAWERYYLVGMEHKKYLDAEVTNAYALMHAKGIYENQRKETEKMRVLNLTRSGYASGQKYAAMLWSGDTTASWETLKHQITEGINMGLSGYPYWTLDIGGFFTVGKKWKNRGCGCNTDSTPKWFWKGRYDEGVKDKGYCELYTRWLEMGCFLPMFRSHGTDTPREIWNFGKKGDMFYDAIEKFIKLRYLLMPYIYSMAGGVRFGRETIMRSLLFDYPEDEKARQNSEEFLFGKSILICPVLKPMYYEAESKKLDVEKKWNCYLPEGAGWYNFWNGEYLKGGQEITVDAPIDQMPIFIKAGSIIPMQKGLSYADEKVDKPLEIHIYTGTDADFLFYQDAGNDYGYENKEYSITKMHWNDKEQKLTISPREGSFPGMENKIEVFVYINATLREKQIM